MLPELAAGAVTAFDLSVEQSPGIRLVFVADRPAYSKLKDAAVALDGLQVRGVR